jgi:hypothetical protein
MSRSGIQPPHYPENHEFRLHRREYLKLLIIGNWFFFFLCLVSVYNLTSLWSNTKVNVKLLLCLTKHHAMKTYSVSGGTHTFSALDEGEWWTSHLGRFTPGTHWLGRLGGLQSRSGRGGEEKKLTTAPVGNWQYYRVKLASWRVKQHVHTQRTGLHCCWYVLTSDNWTLRFNTCNTKSWSSGFNNMKWCARIPTFRNT